MNDVVTNKLFLHPNKQKSSIPRSITLSLAAIATKYQLLRCNFAKTGCYQFTQTSFISCTRGRALHPGHNIGSASIAQQIVPTLRCLINGLVVMKGQRSNTSARLCNKRIDGQDGKNISLHGNQQTDDIFSNVYQAPESSKSVQLIF